MRKEKLLDYLSQVVKAANSGNPIPTEPKWNIWIHRNEGKTHCEVCLKLHECWFAKELTPKWPHHPFCHCILVDIPYVNVMYNCTSDSAYSEYDVYLFNTIRIEIPRKDGSGTVSFITGWMARPNGHIQLATPYGKK